MPAGQESELEIVDRDEFEAMTRRHQCCAQPGRALTAVHRAGQRLATVGLFNGFDNSLTTAPERKSPNATVLAPLIAESAHGARSKLAEAALVAPPAKSRGLLEPQRLGQLLPHDHRPRYQRRHPGNG